MRDEDIILPILLGDAGTQDPEAEKNRRHAAVFGNANGICFCMGSAMIASQD